MHAEQIPHLGRPQQVMMQLAGHTLAPPTSTGTSSNGKNSIDAAAFQPPTHIALGVQVPHGADSPSAHGESCADVHRDSPSALSVPRPSTPKQEAQHATCGDSTAYPADPASFAARAYDHAQASARLHRYLTQLSQAQLLRQSQYEFPSPLDPTGELHLNVLHAPLGPLCLQGPSDHPVSASSPASAHRNRCPQGTNLPTIRPAQSYAALAAEFKQHLPWPTTSSSWTADGPPMPFTSNPADATQVSLEHLVVRQPPTPAVLAATRAAVTTSADDVPAALQHSGGQTTLVSSSAAAITSGIPASSHATSSSPPASVPCQPADLTIARPTSFSSSVDTFHPGAEGDTPTAHAVAPPGINAPPSSTSPEPASDSDDITHVASIPEPPRPPPPGRGAKSGRAPRSAAKGWTAFTSFGLHARDSVRAANPGASPAQVEKLVGTMWSRLSADEKQAWVNHARTGRSVPQSGKTANKRKRIVGSSSNSTDTAMSVAVAQKLAASSMHFTPHSPRRARSPRSFLAQRIAQGQHEDCEGPPKWLGRRSSTHVPGILDNLQLEVSTIEMLASMQAAAACSRA